MSFYAPEDIEKKWQEKWADEGVFKAYNGSEKEKFYALIEFPYPSGDGLHVGHTRPYTAMDIVARSKRMKGYNVLFPIGWDAFGLPTENYAIKHKIHPTEVTKRNIKAFRQQAKNLGYSFDREVDTTDPDYYKWTQWIFLKLFENGLAYKTKMPVNWCTSCKCVLANEEVVDGECERCGSEVVRREKSQWMLKITAYAQRLLDDLDDVDFPSRVKSQQRNWIGRSEGAEVDFPIIREKNCEHRGPETATDLPVTDKQGEKDSLKIFTTRPDTMFGATYMVISPEHPLIERWKDRLSNYDEIQAYRREASKKSDFERTEMVKNKTGVRLIGLCAVNPANAESIPVFVSDYVLMTYGTGAIMAVPGHDTRDWEFAKQYDLPIIEVVSGGNVSEAAFTDTNAGKMTNSGFLDGLEVEDAKAAMIDWLVDKALGTRKINFKLRDWVFARQRYWGEPIPIVHCPQCGLVPMSESQLPLTLPEVESYETSDTGESPLSLITDWVNTTCPKCGAPAQRETDTMPQWAGSSWYFLRYTDPDNAKELASMEALKYWTPVDWYNGGMEHTTLHLLYSRFWHKFLYDIGVAPTKEPYKRRTSHGMILAENGEKMSKSRGNVVNPTEIINEHGADTMRLVIMFIGDFEKAVSWSSKAIVGCRRFLERIWNISEKAVQGGLTRELEVSFHKTIKKVTEDIDQLKFNTSIAALMTLANEMSEYTCSKEDVKLFLRLLSPFAPHIAEELWQKVGGTGLVATQAWPVYDPAKTLDDTVEVAVQVAGKLKGTVAIARDISDEDAIAAALTLDKVAASSEGKRLVRSIVVKNKLINLIFQ